MDQFIRKGAHEGSMLCRTAGVDEKFSARSEFISDQSSLFMYDQEGEGYRIVNWCVSDEPHR